MLRVPSALQRAFLFLALPFAAVALIISAGTISAAGQIKLGIAPAGAAGTNFSLTMQPGESRQLSIKLTNYGTDRTPIRTFSADAYSLVNGGFGTRLDGEPTTATTTWLSYPTETMDLAAGQSIQRDFTVTVPRQTPPGEYLTCIVLQNADATPGDASGGMVLKQIVRQVSAVSIDVPGPRTPGLELGPVAHTIVAGTSRVTVGVRNTGNVRLKPTGNFLLWDSAGKQLTDFPITMDTVYAHTDTLAEVPFAQRLNPGDYTAELKLTDAAGYSLDSGKLRFMVEQPAANTSAAAPNQAPRVAQTDQTPIASGTAVTPTPTSPWIPVAIAFGAGLSLTLVLGGLVFLVARRRRRNSGDPQR